MKTKIGHLLFLLCLLSSTAQSQTNFSKIYDRKIGKLSYESAYEVIPTKDGAYMILGGAKSASQSKLFGISLIKTNKNGDTVWTKDYMSQDENQIGYSIIQTTDGGYAIAGENYARNRHNAMLLKTDSIGGLVWKHSYDDTLNDFSSANAVRQTTDGGYILTGTYMGSLVGISVIKVTSQGNVLWENVYYTEKGCSGECIQQTLDKGYVISGEGQNGSIDGALLLKIDSLGNLSWVKKFRENVITHSLIFTTGVLQTNDNGYILSGVIYSDTNKKIFLLKTNGNGEMQWEKAYSGLIYPKVSKLNNGEYIISATDSGAPSLIKVNSLGDTLWTKVFNVSSRYTGVNSAKPTADNGFVFCGNITLSDTSNIYLVKTDSNANSPCSAGSIQHLSILPVNFTTTTPTINSFSLFQTSITDINIKNTMNIFPNPFSSVTVITVNENLKNGILSIYNTKGQKVKEIQNISGQTITLDRDNLPNGLYFICLTENSFIITTDKLLITD